MTPLDDNVLCNIEPAGNRTRQRALEVPQHHHPRLSLTERATKGVEYQASTHKVRRVGVEPHDRDVQQVSYHFHNKVGKELHEMLLLCRRQQL